MAILITSYRDPDLDGTACAYSYAEFLQNKGVNAKAGIFGKLHREAEFVFKYWKIQKIEFAEKINFDRAILVDTSDLKGLENNIDPLKVLEVIDHRKVHEANQFKNAKVQIELVGAAATLIAEKFANENMKISKESAALIFSAIVSNTINFQAKVTTERDKKMAEYLKQHCKVPDKYVHEMFVHKSTFTQPLADIFENDLATFTLENQTIAIVQLEIISADKFIATEKNQIAKILENIKSQENARTAFLTCIDVEEGHNYFIATDEFGKELLENALNIKFSNNLAKRSGIIMRKEIVPLLKQVLEN